MPRIIYSSRAKHLLSLMISVRPLQSLLKQSEPDSDDFETDPVKPVTLAPVNSESYPVEQQSAKLLDTDMVPTVLVCDSEIRQDGKKFIVSIHIFDNII